MFFTLDGTDYVCSGNAVQADNKSTVSTAGHCVNEGPGSYATNFVFVPAYHDGVAPYGKWAATSLTTSEQWRTEGDFNYDIGFAVVGQVDGQSLTDVVGSQSVSFNQPRESSCTPSATRRPRRTTAAPWTTARGRRATTPWAAARTCGWPAT